MGFGDYDPITNRVNDRVVSDNGDVRKVLATVAFAVSEFFSVRPDATIFFTGSTEQRTRVYGWALSAYQEELAAHFEIRLVTTNGDTIPFSRSVEALGYLIKLHQPLL